jgi:hypothetical protein
VTNDRVDPNTEPGGVVVAIADQGVDDLQPFVPETFADALFTQE